MTLTIDIPSNRDHIHIDVILAIYPTSALMRHLLPRQLLRFRECSSWSGPDGEGVDGRGGPGGRWSTGMKLYRSYICLNVSSATQTAPEVQWVFILIWSLLPRGGGGQKLRNSIYLTSALMWRLPPRQLLRSRECSSCPGPEGEGVGSPWVGVLLSHSGVLCSLDNCHRNKCFRETWMPSSKKVCMRQKSTNSCTYTNQYQFIEGKDLICTQ